MCEDKHIGSQHLQMSHAYVLHFFFFFLILKSPVVTEHGTFSNLPQAWAITEKFRIWIWMPGFCPLCKNWGKKETFPTPPGTGKMSRVFWGLFLAAIIKSTQVSLGSEWSQFGSSRNKCSEPWEIVCPLRPLCFLLAGFMGTCVYLLRADLCIRSSLRRISRRKR